eukprot:2408428-Pyramimonas_sp.AAC.1
MATALGFSWAEILLGADKFHGHVSLFQVVNVAKWARHPLPALALGIAIHRGLGRRRAEGRPPIAGCNQS